MTQASDRLDASVARIAKDIGEVVDRIRSNANSDDSAAVLADCDKLDALSAGLEGLGSGSSTGDDKPAPAGDGTGAAGTGEQG